MGIAPRARTAQPAGAGVASPVAGMADGRDVSRLATNRGEGAPAKQAPVHAAETVGRNDPCPCGSGKKYKKCHGAAG